MVVLLFFLVGSIIVGFLGRYCRFGFWGHFFASVLLTPVVGLLLVLAAGPGCRDRRDAHATSSRTGSTDGTRAGTRAGTGAETEAGAGTAGGNV
ncbi:hypothetical protein [Desulfovibrio psychrotolerans]|uniref:hypothetical protein n=1 Tax=Desulfovibrio psychrotolerans TaxID=415242 RepID=UPI00157B7244|nr:hypothetical protein [Desulfovibrio psychrotolerans]